MDIPTLMEAIVTRAFVRGLEAALNKTSTRCLSCGGSGQTFHTMISLEGTFFVPEYCPSCYGNGIRAFQENDLIRYWQFEDALSKIIEQAKNPAI